jgi:hypothetical protein
MIRINAIEGYVFTSTIPVTASWVPKEVPVHL